MHLAHVRRSTVHAAAVVALVAVGACARGGDKAAPPGSRAPFLLMAVDGLEWSVVTPLLERGRLPNLAAVMARGTYGRLASMDPTYSPVVWTTIATGKSPDEHGIKHFVYDEGGGPRYYTSGHRATKAFWNIYSDYGLTVDVLGWWMTFPAEAVQGVMVAQTNTTGVLEDPRKALWKGSLLRGVDGQVFPPERQAEVMDILEETEASFDSLAREIFGATADAPRSDFTALMWNQSRWAFRADAVYAGVARRLLEEQQPFDLLAVYIGGTDVASHRFWRYAHPEDFFDPPSPEEVATYGRVIDDYYVHVDRLLGEFLARAPRNMGVIIISDHGFHTVNPRGDFQTADEPEEWNSGNHLDAPAGVFIAAGPGIIDATPGDSLPLSLAPESLPELGGVYDVLPTLLALKGLPVGKDMRGEVLAGVIEPAWLERFPVKFVATHDDGAFQESRRERMHAAADQSERLEQLKSLGYIQ